MWRRNLNCEDWTQLHTSVRIYLPPYPRKVLHVICSDTWNYYFVWSNLKTFSVLICSYSETLQNHRNNFYKTEHVGSNLFILKFIVT